MFVLWVSVMSAAILPPALAQGTFAPLYLFTTGSGSLTPFQNGQSLQVGQSYDLTAVPDPGFAFSSWQPVIVTEQITTNYNASGNPILPPNINTSPPLPEQQFTLTPTLTFTMQPEAVLSLGTSSELTQSTGWQANFAPVPEPSGFALTACGLAMIVFLRPGIRRAACTGPIGSPAFARNLNGSPGAK